MTTEAAVSAPPQAAPDALAAPDSQPPLVKLPDGGQRMQSRHDAAVAAVLAKRLAAAEPAKPAPEPAAAPAAAPAPASLTHNENAGSAAERPDNSSQDFATRERRLLADLTQRERDAYEAKEQLKSLQAKLKEREDVEVRRKANPVDALKELGYSYEDLTKGIVEGKYKAPTADQLAIEGTKSEVQQLRERLEKYEAAEQTRTKETALQTRAQEISAVLQRDEVAEKLPYLSSTPWAARHIAQWVDENPTKDADAYAMELEAHLAKENGATLTSDRVLKRLLADEATKSRVMALLGIAKQSEPPAQQAATGTSGRNGPAVIPSSVASEPGTRKTPSRAVSGDERKANALKAVMAKRQAV